MAAFPSRARGPGPKCGDLALRGVGAALLGGPLPALHPPAPLNPERQRLPDSLAQERLLLVPPARKMERTVFPESKTGPVTRPDHERDITCHNSSRAP